MCDAQVLLSTAVTAPLLAVTAGAFAAEEGSVSKAAADVSASVNEIQQTVQDGANQVRNYAITVLQTRESHIVLLPDRVRMFYIIAHVSGVHLNTVCM